MCAHIQAYTSLYIITSLNNHLHVSVVQKKNLCAFYSYSEQLQFIEMK